jgi:hypothetical protein
MCPVKGGFQAFMVRANSREEDYLISPFQGQGDPNAKNRT